MGIRRSIEAWSNETADSRMNRDLDPALIVALYWGHQTSRRPRVNDQKIRPLTGDVTAIVSDAELMLR